MWKLFAVVATAAALALFSPFGSPSSAGPGVAAADGGWQTVIDPSMQTPTSMSPDGRVWVIWGTYPPTLPPPPFPYHLMIFGPGPGDQARAEQIAKKYVTVAGGYIFYMYTAQFPCSAPADHWMLIPTYATVTQAIKNLKRAGILTGDQAGDLRDMAKEGDREDYEEEVAELYKEGILTQNQRNLLLNADFRYK